MTNPADKDQCPKNDNEQNTDSKPSDDNAQEDMFSLDSDIEMEGLVESINVKEQSMKKQDKKS